jgi:hypothetical protein
MRHHLRRTVSTTLLPRSHVREKREERRLQTHPRATLTLSLMVGEERGLGTMPEVYFHRQSTR